MEFDRESNIVTWTRTERRDLGLPRRQRFVSAASAAGIWRAALDREAAAAEEHRDPSLETIMAAQRVPIAGAGLGFLPHLLRRDRLVRLEEMGPQVTAIEQEVEAAGLAYRAPLRGPQEEL
jgi:hypothetical protein